MNMDDEEDVKRITQFLNCTKEENLHEFEYEDFINCEGSDPEENEGAVDDVEDYLLCDLSNTDISKLNSYDPRSTLKPEERVVIDSCFDPDLKNLLLLNRKKNIQLIQLYKQMKDLLMQCQKNIIEKSEIIKAHVVSNKGQSNSTGAWRLCAPYFKDKQLYGSPPNADVFRKKNNNELFIYDLSILLKWSSFECEKLIRAVKLNYNINRQNDVVKKIQTVQNSNPENETELDDLHVRLEELRTNDSEIPPLNSDEYIDWMRVADVFLKDKHSVFECQSFWHIYLHPHINKSSWTLTENAQLKELAKKYNYQSWDEIAEELGNNRTGFTTCMYFYGNLHEQYKKGEFTFEEDARLLDLVYQYRMGSYIPWVKIVQHFKNRTRSQLHYRYTYYLSQINKKKGKFSEAEDVLLMILVDKFGKNFKKCCEYFPSRSMVQCKARYNSNLQGSLKKGSFTIEEDEFILKYVEENGTKCWANLTKRMQRSRGQIRQRYMTIKQFLDCNPESTLDIVPRRRHNLKHEEDSFDDLRIIADQYRDSSAIPSLEEIQNILKNRKSGTREIKNGSDEDVTDESEEESSEIVEHLPFPVSNVNIDDMLTDFFCNSYKLNPPKSISALNLRKAIADVRSVLTALKVDLCIPENFDEDSKLDNVDVAIINGLIEEKSAKPSGCHILRYHTGNPDVTHLIPPNLSTVVGLRSLLIKFSRYKSEENQEMMKFVLGVKRQRYVSGLRTEMINHLLHLPSDRRKIIEDERKLFYRRFHALFRWPAIMTLENPSADLQSTLTTIKSQHGINNMLRFQVKRTYSRADRNRTVHDSVKRLKVSDLPKTPPKAMPLKLTPVTNKSVIEDLMRNKNKKLFYLDNIKCGDLTKTVIREVPLSTLKIKSAPSDACDLKNSWEGLPDSSPTTSNEASCSNQESFKFHIEQDECIITDVHDEEDTINNDDNGSMADDEEDVKKLNLFLSQEYAKGNNDLKGLQNLDIFLKTETETDGNSDDQSTLFE